MGSERERAFREWIYATQNHTITYLDLWDAACDYQRESDAKLIENSAGEYFSLADYIRENK